jgi:two-component system sensor histidine kinase VanS
MEATMADRAPGVSIRLKLTLSYAGFLMVAGVLLLAVVWLFLLRYVPAGPITGPGPFVPNRGDLVRAFAPAAGWALLFLLVFGLAGGWFLAGRMLAPLTRITAATRRAADGSLSHRIELEGRSDEFRELADSFDTMLAQLEAHVDEQRRFAANASHELRTPLTITQALLDVARKDPDRDTEALLEHLHTVNARAIELTEALLTLSRADGRAFTREDVDLSLVAEEAAEALQPLAETRAVSIRMRAEPATVFGSNALLLQLTTNLLHNAIVHNLPSGGSVDLRTRVEGLSAVLEIDNTGEVLSPTLVATLTEPFRRGAERVRTDHAGVGLGLAIVDRIVRAHDGTLDVRPREGSGLRVTVRLSASRGTTPLPD